MRLPLFLSKNYSGGTDGDQRIDTSLYRYRPTHADLLGPLVQHAASARSNQMARLQKESGLQMVALRKLLDRAELG